MIRSTLRDALGDGSFRFRLGTTPTEPQAWLAARADPARVADRRACFDRHPERLAFDGPEPADLRAWLAAPSFSEGARSLGSDLFVVARDGARVVGLAVAFPSGFAPERLLGRGVTEAHAAVPGLEAAIGAPIAGLLARLPEGRAVTRVNAGLAATPGLDRHPASGAPAITDATDPDSLVVRLEEQLFFGLARHIVFAIHLVEVRLDDLRPEERALVARWAGSLPPEVARYKGITPALAGLAAFARDRGGTCEGIPHPVRP